MKNLFFGFVIILVAASCNDDKVKNEAKMKRDSAKKAISVAQPLTPDGFTLNGVLESTATTMISNFESQYKNDQNTNKTVSVWYNYKEIAAINTLLVNEYNTYPQEKKPDGVRIYFGCDKLISGAGTKVTPLIYLVSTKKRNPKVAQKSDHEDYYDHLTNILPGGQLGTFPIYDAGTALINGASLYDKTPPYNVQCPNPGDHYINGKEAYDAVERHCGTGTQDDPSAFNTRAEWFDLCFINSLFNAITYIPNKLDGLRIYFGKRIMEDKTDRDVFILVPTQYKNGIHKDYYKCVESLKSFACTYDWTRAFTGDKKHDSHVTFLKEAGYDKGELCPYKCN